MAEVKGLIGIKGDNTGDLLWGGLDGGDEGEPMEAVRWPEKAVQVMGTFGSGASMSIKGSNMEDGDYEILTDDFGNDLTFTGADMKAIRQNPRYIKPVAVTASGVCCINVSIVMV